MNGFIEVKRQRIASLNVELTHYRHQGLGTEHYHIAANNPENVFMVAFRTLPKDSTGVAHILEHTALCGSKRFPVRDPFFLMIRRSLNTFMNAFTSSDWTAYPFATENAKDYQNLLEVYLDAAFFSRLDPLDFAQEGHRLEFTKPDDPTTPLQYKGVVYNEMKGALSSPVHRLWDALTHYIFPTTTYHHLSGGDPAEIPRLTHDELVAFYQTHYHPSNAVFFSFGDIPATQVQANLEKFVLQHFQAQTHKIRAQRELHWAAPLSVESSYPASEQDCEGDKTHIVMAWLLGPSSDYRQWCEAQLLTQLLLNNSSSPLLHALETTPLGAAPSPICGLEDSNREMVFVCGLEGTKPENANALQSLIQNVIKEVSIHGVPMDQIESVLHQFELSQREITGGSHPYGLQLCLRMLTPALHDGDAMTVLDMEPALAQLRKDCQDPNFIKNLAKKLLIENRHRLRLTLKPDAKMYHAEPAQERQQLDEIQAALTPSEQAHIIAQTQALTERQNNPDQAELLPKVELSDVPKTISIPTGSRYPLGNSELHYYGQGTNGLVYQDIIYKLPAMDNSQLALLPLYNACVTELGVGDKDYVATQSWQARVTGGIYASTLLRSDIEDATHCRGIFTFGGKALTRRYADLQQVLAATLAEVRFDEHPRLRELFAQIKADLNQSITGNGHAYAMTAACSGFNQLAALQQQWNGLAAIARVNQLDKTLGEASALHALSNQLSDLHQQLTSQLETVLLIGEPNQQDDLLQILSDQWPVKSSGVNQESWKNTPLHAHTRELWTTTTQVNFCAKAYPTVPTAHPDAPALTVLGGFLRNGYLHRAIREQGGAYGGGAGQDSGIAGFRFYSYRDPRLADTLHDFDQALEWLHSNAHTGQQLEEAILGVIGQLDKPSSPAGDAKKAFYNNYFGRTREQQQAFREQILKVSLSDLQRVAQTYLQPEKAHIAVITNPSRASELSAFDLVHKELV
jgi:Zn-dependent M16 (insulinase) family peptidase